jgi:hypothetical protein
MLARPISLGLKKIRTINSKIKRMPTQGKIDPNNMPEKIAIISNIVVPLELGIILSEDILINVRTTWLSLI